MKIKKIEPFIICHKLNESFYFSQWRYDARKICLVKITGEDGTCGWGEGYGPADMVFEGIKFFTPFIVEQNALNTETLWQQMYLRSLDFARRGIFLSALSAIDVALWDLKGKILNQPVSVLLGGRKREKVRPYATGLYFSDGKNLTDRLAEEAVRYVAVGFNAIKMKVGLGIKEDAQNVKRVRAAIGPDVELMVDANHAFSLKESVKLCQEIEEYNISWFEEPVSPEHYSGYNELRSKTNIPISGGECEYLRNGFLTLFQQQCVDIAQPDICAAGGITEVKKIADMANTFGIELIPHTWGTGINVAATLQLLANLDNIPGRMFNPEVFLELDRTENPLRDDIATLDLSMRKGLIDIPNRPGLGVDINPTELERYTVKSLT